VTNVLTTLAKVIPESVDCLYYVAPALFGVANGKIETLRDGKTSVFLCETKTFEISEMQDSIAKKIETPRPQIC